MKKENLEPTFTPAMTTADLGEVTATVVEGIDSRTITSTKF